MGIAFEAPLGGRGILLHMAGVYGSAVRFGDYLWDRVGCLVPSDPTHCVLLVVLRFLARVGLKLSCHCGVVAFRQVLANEARDLINEFLK